MEEGLKNPYRSMFEWVRVENMELLAIKECIQGLEKIQKFQRDQNERILQKKKDLDNVSQGKSTMKSFVKSITGNKLNGEKLMKDIQDSEKHVDDCEKLICYLTMYISQLAIPRFKQERGSEYFSFLESFCHNEIEANVSQEKLWQKVYEVACEKIYIEEPSSIVES